LQSKGINKIIVLSHMGYDLDQKLAKRVPGIDIIVGGHSHDVVNGVTPGTNYLKTPTGEPVLIVQGGKNAQWMGVADVLFDPQGRVIPQQSKLFSPFSIPPDTKTLALRNAVLGQPQKLANMSQAYDANGNEYKPDAVAQFTADAIRSVSGADIAFVRSAELRSNFDAGAFTDQDLTALMPFTDPIVRLQLTGDEIMKALNRSAEGVTKKEPHPGMLHPSGMAVTMSKQLGQVIQAYVFNKNSHQWEALDPNKRYKVAIGEFTVINKEFPEFAHAERVEWNAGQPVRSFFAWGLKQAGAPNRPIDFQDDGRLQIV
jgi:2',3'-cyclic-nucleotide 2'-phosphodiesterase (5'-nucleotidase family)